MPLNVEIIFLNEGGLCWRDFFRLYRRKWISTVTGTSTVFDVEEGNKKLDVFWRRLWRERTVQKGSPRLTTENYVVTESLMEFYQVSLINWWIFYSKGNILIDDLRKCYRVSNSIAESLIRKEIFIIAERGQFFQAFYCRITTPRTQKLWMLNTRLKGILPFKTLHKRTF